MSPDSGCMTPIFIVSGLLEPPRPAQPATPASPVTPAAPAAFSTLRRVVPNSGIPPMSVTLRASTAGLTCERRRRPAGLVAPLPRSLDVVEGLDDALDHLLLAAPEVLRHRRLRDVEAVGERAERGVPGVLVVAVRDRRLQGLALDVREVLAALDERHRRARVLDNLVEVRLVGVLAGDDVELVAAF